MGTHPIFESDFDCLTDWSRTFNFRFLQRLNLYLIVFHSNRWRRLLCCVFVMVVRPSSGASNTLSGNVGNGQIDFDVVLSDPFKYIQEYIKKKIRNLEKRKGK